jgi:hypothetical protein
LEGAWGEDLIAIISIACVFKKIYEAKPDGTMQVSGWSEIAANKLSWAIEDAWQAPRKLGSEHNFV